MLLSLTHWTPSKPTPKGKDHWHHVKTLNIGQPVTLHQCSPHLLSVGCVDGTYWTLDTHSHTLTQLPQESTLMNKLWKAISQGDASDTVVVSTSHAVCMHSIAVNKNCCLLFALGRDASLRVWRIVLDNGSGVCVRTEMLLGCSSELTAAGQELAHLAVTSLSADGSFTVSAFSRGSVYSYRGQVNDNSMKVDLVCLNSTSTDFHFNSTIQHMLIVPSSVLNVNLHGSTLFVLTNHLDICGSWNVHYISLDKDHKWHTALSHCDSVKKLPRQMSMINATIAVGFDDGYIALTESSLFDLLAGHLSGQIDARLAIVSNQQSLQDMHPELEKRNLDSTFDIIDAASQLVTDQDSFMAIVKDISIDVTSLDLMDAAVDSCSTLFEQVDGEFVKSISTSVSTTELSECLDMLSDLKFSLSTDSKKMASKDILLSAVSALCHTKNQLLSAVFAVLVAKHTYSPRTNVELPRLLQKLFKLFRMNSILHSVEQDRVITVLLDLINDPSNNFTSCSSLTRSAASIVLKLSSEEWLTLNIGCTLAKRKMWKSLSQLVDSSQALGWNLHVHALYHTFDKATELAVSSFKGVAILLAKPQSGDVDSKYLKFLSNCCEIQNLDSRSYLVYAAEQLNENSQSEAALELSQLALVSKSDSTSSDVDDTILTKIFLLQVHLTTYSQAFNTMIQLHALDKREMCLQTLIDVMCSDGKQELLLKFPHATHQTSLLQCLSFKAKHQSVPIQGPNYMKILYSFHLTHVDHSLAASWLMCYVDKLESLTKSSIDVLMERTKMYLAMINSLSLLPNDDAWLRRETVDTNELQVVTLKQVRQRYIMCLAQLKLAAHLPEMETRRFPLEEQETVQLCLSEKMYDTAITIIQHFEMNWSVVDKEVMKYSIGR